LLAEPPLVPGGFVRLPNRGPHITEDPCVEDLRRRIKGIGAERAQLLFGGIGRIIDTCSRYLM
jgi:hypothetical protein